MPTLADARQALAQAVTDAGLECLPYPVDNPSPPIAFVDNMSIDFTAGVVGGTFCAPGMAVATIVALELRNDRPGATANLENLIRPVTDALDAVGGLRLLSAASGQLSIGGQDLPAVTFTVSFNT